MAGVSITWNGAVVAITGGSRGIGRKIAEAASARGAAVGLLARSQPDLEETASALPGRTATAVADVARRDQVQTALAQLASELGPIDILVNNAGLGSYGAHVEAGGELVQRLMGANFFGAVHAVDAVVGDMISRRRGHIVMLGSIAGKLGAPFEAAYSASKFAMTGFSEALAVELAPHGVGLSMVHPGPVDTGFFAARGVPYARRFPRPVSPDRVAAAVIRSVERDRFETVVPRWLQFAIVVRSIAPGIYRAGAIRSMSPRES
jgi:short-subunit dehydrogenase